MELSHKDFTCAQLFVIYTALSFSVKGKMLNLIFSNFGQITIWHFMRKDATTRVIFRVFLVRLFLISVFIIHMSPFHHP